MLTRRKSEEGKGKNARKIYRNERNRSGNLEAEFLRGVLKSGGISTNKKKNNNFRDDEEDAAVIVSNVGVFADG